MNSRKKFNSNSGFTFIEILITLSLYGVVVSGIMSISTWLNSSVALESAKVDRDIENVEMLKLITQPQYFGALIDFPDNLALAQCMKTDLIECTTDKDYPLTAFNLGTKLPLSLASSTSTSQNIRDEISFRVHCPNNTASCDRALYFTVTVKTFINYLSFKTAVVEKKGIVTPEFTNVVTFVPDSTVAAGRPINVIIFIDNSNSMLFAKDQIKSALDGLINKLSTMNVTIGLYSLADSSTHLPNISYYLDANGNKDYTMPPYPYPANFTYYLMQPIAGRWRDNRASGFNPSNYVTTQPMGANAIFPFLTTDDPTLRDNKLNSLKNLIESYFSYPSANALDIPLCTLSRFFETPSSPSPFTIDPFTPTAIMVITNEDDETDLNLAWHQNSSCVKGYLGKWTVPPPTYNYWGKYQVKYISFTANVTMDGAPYVLNSSFRWDNPYDPKYNAGDSCNPDISTFSSAWTENMITTSLNVAKTYSYTAGSGYTVTACKVDSVTTVFRNNLSAQDSTICPSVEAGTYPYIPPGYIPGTCYETYSSGATFGTTIEQYEPVTGFLDPVEAAYQTLKNHVSLNNVLYMPIIHPDLTTCTQTPGSRVGTRLMALGSKPGMNTKVVPICSPDYSSQLSNLDQWIAEFASNDIQLSASVAANFNSVELVRNGSTVSLTRNVDYSLVDTTLAFKPGILLPNDIIRVYLK